MTQTGFGNSLRKLRLRASLSQGQVAARLGCSVAFYSAVETGRKPPSTEMLDAIEREFDLSEAACRRMHAAAASSIDQVRVSTKATNQAKRELALDFKRKFESLNDDQVTQLKELLK